VFSLPTTFFYTFFATEPLQAQGFQLNQNITFLSDGGDTVRDLQRYLSPYSEHILDWFHITMRITVMRNIAKSLPTIVAEGLTADEADRYLESAKEVFKNNLRFF